MMTQSTISDYWQLTKPRVTLMVIVSTFAGFYLASSSSLDLILFASTLLGSWLVAGGTNALNQLIERDQDALMKRTRTRPLPAGRLQSHHALVFATTISLSGLILLFLAANLLTCFLAALTLASYILIYTPMKRKTWASTIVGAVPGALPAMGGWAAVRGAIGVEAWVLFAILFFWQLPHFFAIAWIYRDDYARGGFAVLPMFDPKGFRTGAQIVINCLALLSVSLLLTILGVTGAIYFLGALMLGIVFLLSGVRMALRQSNRYARQVLRASIIYLPVLVALMFIDKAGV